jgi:hypothetical protein
LAGRLSRLVVIPETGRGQIACGCVRLMIMRAVGWCGSCGGAAGRW